MTDFLVLGTDTDVGKTTFALLWLTRYQDQYEYWKPIETGPSDTETIGRLVPGASVHPPLQRFREAIAPILAARREGADVLSAAAIAARKPKCNASRRLLIETFGSPLSPLNETQLQAELIQAFRLPSVLVSSSAVGAIGRTLQCLRGLEDYNLRPAAVILLGPIDEFAAERIHRDQAIPVVSIRELHDRSPLAIAEIVRDHQAELATIRGHLQAAAQQTESMQMKPLEPEALLRSDQQHVWHPYTPLRDADPPLVVVEAQDEFIWLADGTRLIDAISSWWTILHGHRHPVLMAALREASRQFDHVQFAGLTHRYAVELAEMLLSSAALEGGRVFYSDNGSTAVEVALKMAYQYWCHRGEPQRTLFVGFENGYHGDTFGAMAVGRDPIFFGRFEPLLFKTEIVPVSAERLDDVITRHKNKVAAVIIEPLVQGAGGMRMHTPEDLRAIFEVTKSHGVLFIADEVMTGGGRTGTLWAHQAANIQPDLICAGKTLAGGVLTLAATLASSRIVEAFDTADRSQTFFHGHSFTAHPLACAVAVANWKMLTAEPNPVPQKIEAFWKEALRPLRGHPRVKDVRIRGTIAAVELDVPGGYLADVGREIRRRCLQEGVLLRPLGSVVYAMPPMCTSQNSLANIVGAIEVAVTGIYQ